MNERGFGMIEAVVASALLLLLGALTVRAALSLRAVARGGDVRLVASRLAASTVAACRAAGPGAVPAGRTDRETLPGTVFDIEARWTSTPDPSFWKLRVVIGWAEGPMRRNLALETLHWDPLRD